MQWNDNAIIISAAKYGESSGIVTVLAQERGLFKGLVKGIASAKQRGIYQTGNVVEISWKARLAEHLGAFSAEMLEANAAFIITAQEKLLALTSITSLLEKTLPEREPAPEIFSSLYNLIKLLVGNKEWLREYLLLELNLLSHLGFGLDLDSCAATNKTEDLIYISPKSGRAVSGLAGSPYKDKLFKFPSFLKKESNENNPEEFKDALKISAYFLEKYVFSPHNMKIPAARIRLMEYFNSVSKSVSASNSHLHLHSH